LRLQVWKISLHVLYFSPKAGNLIVEISNIDGGIVNMVNLVL
jgi:hypothetical protein